MDVFSENPLLGKGPFGSNCSADGDAEEIRRTLHPYNGKTPTVNQVPTFTACFFPKGNNGRKNASRWALQGTTTSPEHIPGCLI